MDPRTDELRAAHDVLAEVYAERLPDLLARMPIEQAVLGLVCRLVRERGQGTTAGTTVGDIGCGTGRLAPFLTAQGLTSYGVDLSPEMIRVARRDYPGHSFEQGDLRRLPFADGSLDGVVCWYSLMYLHPEERSTAYAELARVVKPGGYLATAFKIGDGALRRGGRSLDLGIGFDIYWFSPEQLEQMVAEAGFRVTFFGGRPADPDEAQPQGYLVAERL